MYNKIVYIIIKAIMSIKISLICLKHIFEKLIIQINLQIEIKGIIINIISNFQKCILYLNSN